MDTKDLTDLIGQLAQAQLSTERQLKTLCDTLVQNAQSGSTTGQAASATSASPATVPGPDLQALAKQISEKYKSIHLDTNHRLHEERTGIRRDDQKQLNIISKGGRFLETAFKIIQSETSDDGSLSAIRVNELYTVLSAHLAYLQDEYGICFVQSLGDPTTAKLFRQLRKNTSALPPDAIEDLRAAAQVSANLPQPASSGQHSTWRGSYTRGRGRGFAGRPGRYQHGRGGARFGRPQNQQQGYQNDSYLALMQDMPSSQPQS